VRAAGRAADGSVVAAAYLLATVAPGGAAFVERYRARFGTEPGMFALEAYDAASAFLAAVRAGRTRPAEVSQYLSTVNFVGLSRTVRFAGNGENLSNPLYLYTVNGGRITVTDEAATAPR
jgi:branched-chain amino acid transport system substrate-binding protein